MNSEYPLKLSIIVPVYNVEEYLERCVNSLLHQDIDKSEYEIILVNDGSTDRSYEISEKLKAANENIVLLSQKNQGQSVARNKGIDIARGKYIMFVDSDDYIECNVLGRLVKMSDINSLDLYFFKNVYDCADGHQEERKSLGFKDNEVYDGEYIVLHGMEVSVIWLNIYSTEFLRSSKVRFYEGIVHQDVEFDYKLYPLAKRVMFTDMIVYHYCINGESTIHTKTPEKVRLIVESDFHVACSVILCSSNLTYSPQIRKYYKLVGNSIAVSALLQLCRNHFLEYKTKRKCLATAKRLGVYTVRGKTNSWKTTLLARILNCEWVLNYLMR
jgi:glycosyltransferase involved in cell wall biosynthesis